MLHVNFGENNAGSVLYQRLILRGHSFTNELIGIYADFCVL